MNKDEILSAIKLVKDNSKKRNFTQTFDLVINLKSFDIKKDTIDQHIIFPFNTGKKVKICAFVGKELLTQAKVIFDKVIFDEEFPKWANDKKAIKKLISDYDYFLAQANLMGQVATIFGKVLGPKGKMPDPKANCVIPPKMSSNDLKKLYSNLQKTMKITTKSEPSVKCIVGNENMDDKEICENILTVYNFVLHLLPLEKNNVASILIKLTMSPVIKIGEKKEDIEKRLKDRVKEKSKKSYKGKKELKNAEKNVMELKDKKIKEIEKSRK